MEPATTGKIEFYCDVFFNENIHQDTVSTQWCTKQPFAIGLKPQTDLHHQWFSRIYCKTCNQNLPLSSSQLHMTVGEVDFFPLPHQIDYITSFWWRFKFIKLKARGWNWTETDISLLQFPKRRKTKTKTKQKNERDWNMGLVSMTIYCILLTKEKHPMLSSSVIIYFSMFTI